MGRRTLIEKPYQLPGGVGNWGALGNWVFIQNNIGSQTQTNSTSIGVPLLAACIQLKYSGTVRVDCNVTFNGGTTAKTIEHKLIARPFSNVTAVPRFTAGGGGATIDSSNVALGHDVAESTSQQNPANWACSLTSDSAGLPANAINFNGVQLSANALPFGQRTTATLTGLLSAQSISQWPFQYSGIVPNLNNNIPDQHWPVGDFLVVAVMLDSVATNGVVQYGPSSLTLQEQPLP